MDVQLAKLYVTYKPQSLSLSLKLTVFKIINKINAASKFMCFHVEGSQPDVFFWLFLEALHISLSYQEIKKVIKAPW